MKQFCESVKQIISFSINLSLNIFQYCNLVLQDHLLQTQMRSINRSAAYKSSSREVPNSKRTNANLYNLVTNYRSYTELPELIKQDDILKKFAQYSNKKVLFIFGPSGCGKHMLINNFVTKHNISHEYRAQLMINKKNQFDFQDFDSREEEKQKKWKGLRDLINDSISGQSTKKIQIYEDFPIPNSETPLKQLENIRQFKKKFFSQLKKSACKVVFILNSQIYNRYYIMPKDIPDQILQITLKPYLVSEIKPILKNFTKEHPNFQWIWKSKDSLDEIIEISGGDMRKVLLNLFQQTISNSSKMEFLNKENKMQYKFKLKNDQKFPLFHMLGKYLYAKRFDEISRKDRPFTRKQLQTSDPPFYFDPVDMYLRSNVPLVTFADLLFENYITKISQIRDASQISELFSFLDEIFPAFITNKRVDSLTEESQKLYIFLLTWGIILKNKSSANIDKKFSNFRKSEIKYIETDRNNKRQILRRYFPESSVSNLVHWGYIVKNISPNKQYLIKKLIKKRTRQQILIREEKEKVLGQEDQEQRIKQLSDYKEKDFLDAHQSKRQKYQVQQQILKQMLGDESDIEQQS